jgi:hypothetical protein
MTLPSDGPALPLENSEPTPSITVFFQAWIWLACTPYRLDSSATVLSSRTAANATFALKSTPCFLRTFAIRNPWPSGRFRGGSLS